MIRNLMCSLLFALLTVCSAFSQDTVRADLAKYMALRLRMLTKLLEPKNVQEVHNTLWFAQAVLSQQNSDSLPGVAFTRRFSHDSLTIYSVTDYMSIIDVEPTLSVALDNRGHCYLVDSAVGLVNAVLKDHPGIDSVRFENLIALHDKVFASDWEEGLTFIDKWDNSEWMTWMGRFAFEDRLEYRRNGDVYTKAKFVKMHFSRYAKLDEIWYFVYTLKQSEFSVKRILFYRYGHPSDR
jgi:hypothetical protein